MEMLKRNHIPFQTKVIVGNREVDFIVGSYAIDLDAHPQNIDKNIMLIREGYIPIHYNNWDVVSPLIEEWFKKINASRNRISR